MLSISAECLRPGTQGENRIHLDQGDSARLNNNTQAIITSYQFHCCGEIESWQAFVEPNGGAHSRGIYNIQFQVWRPSPTVNTDSCYSLVGENYFSSIEFETDSSINVAADPGSRIPVREGDVIGYYTFVTGNNRNSGIELSSDLTGETVWYLTSPGLSPVMPGEHMEYLLQVGIGNALSSSTSLGPILTAVICEFNEIMHIGIAASYT